MLAAGLDLCRRLLVPDPSQRLTAKKALNHEFVSSAGGK